jgi:uncharacterized protein (DUF111 family)
MNKGNSSTSTPPEQWIRPEESYHAHWDCFSGAAGDMMLAACLDASDNGSALLPRIQQCIEEGLPELKGEFSLEMKRVLKSDMGSIAANYVTVKSRYNHAAVQVPAPSRELADGAPSGHSHSHNHEEDIHNHSLEHGHSHSHNHQLHSDSSERSEKTGDTLSHSHSHDHALGPLRNLPQIRKMLIDAPPTYIPVWVRDHAIEAFTELAKAEAMTHGATSVESVHFHEVGAIDSIVDTVGTLLALYYIGVCTVSCSRLPLGEGTVWTDHGLLPVPAPATLRLLVDMPTCPGPPGVTGELVTPTAAALLRVLTQFSSSGRPPCMTIRKIGIGAGTKDFPKHANIIRLIIGDNVITK